jgi:hypothetical protein
MKNALLIGLPVLFLASCSTPKTYFNSNVRTQVENSSIPISKVQFYVDRDVEIRREVSSSTAKVSSGVVKLENGKYVNIVTLKKNTPGVCTHTFPDKVDISFEVGDGKFLTFGKLKNRDANAPYTLYANSWLNDLGEINYDGKQYYILPEGSEAKLMIKKNVLRTVKVDKHEMNGRKIGSGTATE